jgi:hypothetical protein
MLYELVYGCDSDTEYDESSNNDVSELLKNEIGVDSFASEFVNMVNVNVVGFVLFGITYSYLLWKFLFNICYVCFWGIHYLAVYTWDALDDGQEWLQLAFIVWSIVCGWGVLKFANDMDERVDNYIMKLKAELAEKDAIIAELSSK